MLVRKILIQVFFAILFVIVSAHGTAWIFNNINPWLGWIFFIFCIAVGFTIISAIIKQSKNK